MNLFRKNCLTICVKVKLIMNMKTGNDLFIVDNSDDEWKVLNYLAEWSEISSRFDIATGYFEIGSLMALDGKW